MDLETASIVLAALAHSGRLAVFRLLVQGGPEGLAAGAIADAVASPPSTLSANLNVLSHAGLIRSRRQSRSIIYSADFGRMNELLGFLVEDCCNGAPQVCAPLAEATSRALCVADNSELHRGLP